MNRLSTDKAANAYPLNIFTHGLKIDAILQEHTIVIKRTISVHPSTLAPSTRHGYFSPALRARR